MNDRPGNLRPLSRMLRGALLFAALAPTLAWGQPVPGQQPAAPAAEAAAPAAEAPAGPGPLADWSWRLHLIFVDQLAFREHPFYQITRDPGYQNGDAAAGSSLSYGNRHTTSGESFPIRQLHDLPSFGVEAVRPLAIPFPQGVGLGLDYFAFSQADVEAAGEGSVVVPIKADTYLYLGALRFYVFDPMEPGMNFFFGFALGGLEGALNTRPIDATVSYSRSPVGGQRLGLESKGENWGFRYEVILLNAEKVQLDHNPYPAPATGDTLIDFSGSIIRLALFYQFD